MNMVEATLERHDGGYAARFGSQRLALGEELVAARPALKGYEGRKVVLGIRPEHLEDAALAGDARPTAGSAAKVQLREALGSEIMVHFDVDAPPALTEDVRELAQDLGDERVVTRRRRRPETTMVGRFGARSKIEPGDVVEVAVDTRSLHFFDPETSLGIYDEDTNERSES